MSEHTVGGAAHPVNPSENRTRWNDALIGAELRRIIGATGTMPSANALRDMGRNDLACAISKHGGFVAWAERVGAARAHSDSDTGWEGERAVVELFRAQGIEAVRSERVKAPFDLLAGGCLRVDVKAARFAEYGACRGWFYRIAKVPQADLIVLHQLDTGDFCGLPWHVCPTSNVTISRGGGKYAGYVNNWPLIRRMLAVRAEERRAS